VNRPGNHEGLLASVNFRRGGVIRAATITSGAPPNRWRLIGFRLRVIPVFWRARAAATRPFIEIRNCLSCALSGESLVNNWCLFGESHNLPREITGENLFCANGSARNASAGRSYRRNLVTRPSSSLRASTDLNSHGVIDSCNQA
jgi:hypothetical protein